MGDQEHGAVERPERLLELLDRGQVEVVRRFVEHEAVDAGDREQREDSARAFAGRECARRSQHMFRAESELRERRTARRRVRTGRALERVHQVPVAGEGVARLLEPAEDDGRPEPLRSRIEGQLAQEGVQQGRLAAAVGAEDRDALAVADLEVDRTEHERHPAVPLPLRAAPRRPHSVVRSRRPCGAPTRPTASRPRSLRGAPARGRSRAPCRRAARSTAYGSDG